MTGPESYAHRVRAHPYGPREMAEGGVVAWFHGPFAVLTFTGDAGTVTVSADLDVPSVGADLVEVFTTAAAGRAACLPFPERLAGERSITDDVPVVVRRLAVSPETAGARLTLSTNALEVDVTLNADGAARIAGEIRRWTST